MHYRLILRIMMAMNLELKQLEEQLLQHEIRTDSVRLDELLSDDFIEIGASGRVYTKAEIIENLPTEPGGVIRELSDFQARPLAEGIALVTYKITRSVQGSTETARSLRSSIWKRTGGQWQLVFHQGTLQT